MIKVNTWVRRKPEHQDIDWISSCEQNGFKPDTAFAVEYVSGSKTIYFQGAGSKMGGWYVGYFEEVDAFQGEKSNTLDNNNMVTKPKHYEFFEGVEAITIIARSVTEKQFAGYCMGNALKYRLRAGKKFNTEEDLKKADYYKELFQKHRHECIDEDI